MKIGEVRHSSLSSRVLCPGPSGTAPSAAGPARPGPARPGQQYRGPADDGRPPVARIPAAHPLPRVAAAAGAAGANAKRIIGVKCSIPVN